MKQAAKYFLCGGVLYFIIEIIWRTAVGHRSAHPIVILMAGIVCALVCLLDDWNVNIVLNSFVGGIFATALELVIGLASLYLFNERLWHYGGITFKGIISLKWSFLWVGLCFACVVAKRILQKWRVKQWRK